MVVFSLKTGTGLLLHNLIHKSTAGTKVPGKENEKKNEFSYTCNCIDNFLIPFDEACEPFYLHPVLALTTQYIFNDDQFPLRTPGYSSLRGPPACPIQYL